MFLEESSLAVYPSLIKLQKKTSKDKRQDPSHINLKFIKLSLRKNNEKFHLCHVTLWKGLEICMKQKDFQVEKFS